jgi:transposase-like protein
MAKGDKAAPKKAKRQRREYSKEKRAEILAAAAKEHLTAAAVQKRFGVKPVTYYSWRKKLGAVKARGAQPIRRNAQGSDVAGQVRAEVRAKMAALLPGIVRAEVAGYLDQVFRSRRRRRVTIG